MKRPKGYFNYEVNINRDRQTGRVTGEYWRIYVYGERYIHRDDDLPAQIAYDEYGRVISQVWFQWHEAHRENAPAKIAYRWSGPPPSRASVTQTWKRNGAFHRDGEKPAIISRDESGRLTGVFYFAKGKKHRTNGAAVLKRMPDGTLKKEYWRKGKQFKKPLKRNRIKPVI